MFRCVGFGLVFAWIVFGSYGQRKEVDGDTGEAALLGGRRLLQTDSTDSLEVRTSD